MFKLSITGSEGKVALRDIKALRLAFFVAGLMIIIGAIGSHLIHPYFHVLPFLVAFGLLFSATFGWCPMAMVMERFFVKTQ